MNLLPHKCCLTDLAFGFMPLERAGESFLCHFWVLASIPASSSCGGSQDSAPLLGGGSLHDDDRPVVEGTRTRGSTGKGQRRGGALEKGRRSDVAGGEEHDHRVS